MWGGGCVVLPVQYIAYESSLGTLCIQATFLPVMYTSLLFTLCYSMGIATSCIIVFTVLGLRCIKLIEGGGGLIAITSGRDGKSGNFKKQTNVAE